jgi:hypothetical protein
MKRYFSLILAIAATVSAQIVPSTGNVRGPTSATDNAVARYDGTTGKLVQNSGVTIDDSGNLTVSGTTGVTATDLILGTSGPSAKSSINARAARQGLVFDGTSASGGTVTIPALKTEFTIAFWANPATISSIQGVLLGSGSLAGNLNISSGLPAIFNGTVYKYSSASATAGKMDLWAYVLSGGTGTWYKNGIAAGSDSDAGTYPDAITAIGVEAGTKKFNGTLIPLIYNRALSAAEVVSLFEAGVPAAADYNTASNTSIVAATFASGWVTNSGSPTIGATLSMPSGASSINNTFTLVNGKKIRFTVTVDSISAGDVQYYNGDGGGWTNFATAAGTYTVEFSATSTGANFGFKASGGTVVLSSPSVFRSGLLLAPDAGQAGSGLTWTDQSGNGAHVVLPESGVSWNVPSAGPTRVRGTTNTNGNQKLLAATSIRANYQITRVRARSRSGTPSVTIGTTSGGSEIVSSVSLSTTWQNLTIALTGGIVSSASSVWIGSNSTDVVETDITIEPLNF